MGDMCVCTGPPDTIVLGSVGVFIGGKPAARMGDQCAHGGKIVVGMPTVLIGEAGGGGSGIAAPSSNVIVESIPTMPATIKKPLVQVAVFKIAAENGIALAHKEKGHDPKTCPECRKRKTKAKK
jgi:hypothetical protein